MGTARALALTAMVLLLPGVAQAAPLNAGPPVLTSAADPLAACPPDPSGVNYPGAEVEPFIGVNPTNRMNIVGVYQQDRYTNGGSKGTTATVSTNPWVTVGPDGVAHAMSLVTDPDIGAEFGANGMVYNRSTTGGLTWERPILLITDPAGRFLNDKNSMTADPNDADFVYAVWDRVQNTQGSINNPENVLGRAFKGPIYFTRTTNGGDSWEPARKIYETGANKQTIGNQIVVSPNGTLYDFFGDITNSSNRRGGIGPVKLSFIRSSNRGATWTSPQRVDDMIPMSLIREDDPIDVEPFPCPDPTDQGACPIRAGDLIPEVAVDERNGTLYAVWMDARFDGGLALEDHDNIAFTQSTNGGASWSTPIKVNKTPTSQPNYDQQAFTPSVDVDGNGTVTVTYYDLRNNDADDPARLEADYFAVSCESASENCANPASWEEERITPTSFDIRDAPFARGYFLGDYMGLDNDGTDFVSLFGQAFTNNDASQYFSRLTP